MLALSSAHHPQRDRQTEILNTTIEQMLRANLATDCSSWAKWLGEITFAYNLNVHRSTGYSPNFLLFGYHPRGAAGILNPGGDHVFHPFLPSQKGENFIEAMESHIRVAWDTVVLAQERQACAYNKSRCPVESIEEGDYVLVNPHSLEPVDVQGTGRKLVQCTIGPFKVMEKINLVVYRLQLLDTYSIHPVFNLGHLRKYHMPKEESGELTKLPDTQEYLKASEEYMVEAILGHTVRPRKDGNQRMFCIFSGKGTGQPTILGFPSGTCRICLR
jgi:hypothetical protein